MSASFFQSNSVGQISGYIAAASWTVSVWDWVLNFGNEVAFVWPMPPKAYIKWLYFCGEYGALAVQTAVLVAQGYIMNHPLPLQHCRIYRGIQVTGIALLMLCFDTVLLLRIYALYGPRTRSSALATFAVLAEFLMTAATGGSTVPVTVYDPVCVMTLVPKPILVFVTGTFISQTTLLWLAYRKRERLVRRNVSIACVTIRDGILVFFSAAVILVTLVIFILHDSRMTTLMGFFFPLFVSVGTCRIILNLQRVPYGVSTDQFTSPILGGLDRSADSYLLSDLSS